YVGIIYALQGEVIDIHFPHCRRGAAGGIVTANRMGYPKKHKRKRQENSNQRQTPRLAQDIAPRNPIGISHGKTGFNNPWFLACLFSPRQAKRSHVFYYSPVFKGNYPVRITLGK